MGDEQPLAYSTDSYQIIAIYKITKIQWNEFLENEQQFDVHKSVFQI